MPMAARPARTRRFSLYNMTALASVIIPCSPEHLDRLPRAVASAEAQTVACEVIPVIDHNRHGPGWARNAGAEMASGLFLVFLDADDELEAGFVQTLARQYEPGMYVYSDWYEGSEVQRAPDADSWVDNRNRLHLVTTLITARMFMMAGGFNATLPAIEDRDFYLRLRSLGFCGKHIPLPLVHYHNSGAESRSARFKRDPERDRIRRYVDNLYRGKIMAACGKCGGGEAPVQPAGNKAPGDVLAEVLYAPANQIVMGRYYERPRRMGARIWVAREHVQARPDLWRVVSDPDAEGPDIDLVIRLANQGTLRSAS